jgi:hypothetical protein
VTKYATKTAVLTLQHDHPPGNRLRAFVNIRLVLETIKAQETQVGEWVHVMGYVDTSRPKPNGLGEENLNGVHVQAIVLWSAGPMKLDRYEEVMDRRKAAGLTSALPP